MSDELILKPCPFCGEEAKVRYQSNLYGVRCKKCLAAVAAFDTEAEAVTAWNKAMGATDKNVGDKERPKGEWVDGLPYVNSHWWVCSVCHVSAPENHTGYNFCPSCGADMRGEDGKA